MQKKLTVALALAIGVFTACDRDATAPNADGRIVSAPLAAVTTNTSEPFNQILNVPCANGGAGEDVQFSGDLHVLFLITVNRAAVFT